jgi:hypothetical protein
MRPALVSLVLVLFLLAGAKASAAPINLLTNPGFETGDFTGWTVSGPATHGVAPYGTPVPAYYPGSVNVRSGDYAAYGVVLGHCCTTPEPIILSQVFTVAPNQILDIGFFASNWSATGVGAGVGDAPNNIRIHVNGTQILPEVSYFLFDNDASWYSFGGTYANGAATTIAVDFTFLASGTGNFPASLDDFHVDGLASPTVPEPGSMILLGTGLLGIGRAWRTRRG